jgi:hypothetical protein
LWARSWCANGCSNRRSTSRGVREVPDWGRELSRGVQQPVALFPGFLPPISCGLTFRHSAECENHFDDLPTRTRTKPLAQQTLRVLDSASHASTRGFHFCSLFSLSPHSGNCCNFCRLQVENRFNPHSPVSTANTSGFLLASLSKMPRIGVRIHGRLSARGISDQG